MGKRTPDHEQAGRRAFLKLGGVAAAGLWAMPPRAKPPARPRRRRTRRLRCPCRCATSGAPGTRSASSASAGKRALERAHNEAVAVPIVERALDLGVNYIDTSSIYGGPERWSERYIGTVMKRRRAQAFLASKTKERTRDGSLRMIEESLKLLQTDHLDLWQLHDIGLAEDVDAVFAKGGAMEALRQAQEQKMVRYLGITGHFRPEPLMEAIRRHPVRHHLDGPERGRPAPLQFSGTASAAGGGEADGHHRHEGAGAQPAAVQLDAAAAGAAAALLGRRGDCHHAGAAHHARGDVFFALAPGQHGDYRLRFNRATGRERATWRASSRRSANTRWRRSPSGPSRFPSRRCSSVLSAAARNARAIAPCGRGSETLSEPRP